MTNKLKSLFHLFFAILSCFSFQICPSQAADDEDEMKYTEEEKQPLLEMRSSTYSIEARERVYKRFLKGALVYKPYESNSVFEPSENNKEIILPISELDNPLEGTFDLSRCVDDYHWFGSGLFEGRKCFRISTGYRKMKKEGNENKIEIWVTPRFLIEEELDGTASHFKPIMSNWNSDAEIGLFVVYGANDLSCYQYLTTQTMDEICNDNLFNKLLKLGCRTRLHGTPLEVTYGCLGVILSSNFLNNYALEPFTRRLTLRM